MDAAMVQVDFDELDTAYEFVNFGSYEDHQAFICRKTGKIYWQSDNLELDEEDQLPEEFGLNDFIEVPKKNELDLGKNLVFQFAEDHLPDDLDDVSFIFSKPGAYSHWKRLLDKKGLLKKWYDYENTAKKQALKKWCEDYGIELIYPEREME